MKKIGFLEGWKKIGSKQKDFVVKFIAKLSGYFHWNK